MNGSGLGFMVAFLQPGLSALGGSRPPPSCGASSGETEAREGGLSPGTPLGISHPEELC